MSLAFVASLFDLMLYVCTFFTPPQGHGKFSKVLSQHLPRIFMRPNLFGFNIHRVTCCWLHDIFSLSYRIVFFCLRERHLRKVDEIFSKKKKMRIHRLEADFCPSKRLDSMSTSFAKLSRWFMKIDTTEWPLKRCYRL